MVLCLTAWGAFAIYYGDSQSSGLQTTLAGIFSLVGLVAVVGIWFRPWRSRVLGVHLTCFVVTLGWWLSIEPGSDRNWAEETARLPYAEIDGDHVTMHNVRNFRYRTETDFTPAWYDKTYDLAKLDTVDIYAIYWMGPAIAHTIVSFGFGGEDYLAVSIEARKEQGEGYSTIKGFFRQYEQIHIAADERDVIRLRTNFRQNPPEDVYRYRIQGSSEFARQFFLSYVYAINQEKAEAAFYNTLLSNCTTMIWAHARDNPEHLPFSWQVLASGYAMAYLYDMGRLDTSVSFAELTRRAYVNPIAQKLGDVDDFSQRIRAGSQ